MTAVINFLVFSRTGRERVVPIAIKGSWLFVFELGNFCGGISISVGYALRVRCATAAI